MYVYGCRSIAFVGGIDLAYNRWDDGNHQVADEDGLLFPGKDYRQPAEGGFKPVRQPGEILNTSAALDKSLKDNRRGSANNSNLNLNAIAMQYDEQTRAISACAVAADEKQTERLLRAAPAAQNMQRMDTIRDDVSEVSEKESVNGQSEDSEQNKDEDRYEPLSPEELQVSLLL